MTIKAVIFDFIGTLASVENYSMEDSKAKLSRAIVREGFDADPNIFLKAYSEAHEKYQVIRYRDLVEITNAVWISDALNSVGFKTTPEDTCVKTAVNVFFEDYIESLKPKPCARSLLKRLASKYRLGLISNFTYAPVIHVALRKLGMENLLSAILISEETGWRKPNPRIFQEALRRLAVLPEETIYVGDSPLEDIKGAKKAGMKTAFVPSQFYSSKDLDVSKQKPDVIAKDLCELQKTISRLL